MKDLKISILGCGKMSSALSIGIHNKYPRLRFFGFNPTFLKSKILMEKLNGMPKEKILDLPISDIYLLGAKPQNFKELAKALSPHLPKEAMVISIMAGVSTNILSEKLKTKRIVRVMPNTPCMIGEGVCSIYFSEKIDKEERKLIRDLFESVGSVFELTDESQFDISTVFTGSGPGFIFEFANIMLQTITEMGIDAKIAKEMINQTFLGSSKLMIQSGSSYDELRESVTSKKGMTEAGLKVLKDKDLSNILGLAFKESLNRCKELGKSDD